MSEKTSPPPLKKSKAKEVGEGGNPDEIIVTSPLNPSNAIVNVPFAQFHQTEEKLDQIDFAVHHLRGTPYITPLRGNYPVQHDIPPVVYNHFQFSQDAHLAFTSAGPHRNLHFNPQTTTIGIVNCGGLCPGLNDVIRALVIFATEVYKVKRVIGFKYGYRGLCNEGLGDALDLTPEVVKDIHRVGGSFLGSSRGWNTDDYASEILENLRTLGVNILFCLGGDGTQRGAERLYLETQKTGADIAVIGIPKTIDNDLAFVARTFGFETAAEAAVRALKAGEAEARSALNGVGLVKLMGRYSGFVACQAAVSFGGAHMVLIPENSISLATILDLLDARLKQDTYAVVVVAEGFGEDLVGSEGKDASGNKKLGDIGVFLKKEIEKHMKAKYEEFTVKYIDPSYIIRSCVANCGDSAFCIQLAAHGVHEGMFGSTGCLIGQWHSSFTAVPIKLCVSKRKYVNLQGTLWRSVREQCVKLDTDFDEETKPDIPTVGTLHQE